MEPLNGSIIQAIYNFMIERNISGIDLMVDTNSSRDIYFSEQFLKENNIASQITQNEILNILSKDGFVPLYLMWEIIDKCNFSCPFCYIVGHSDNKLTRFKKIKPYLDDLINEGLLYCLITGGEALYHKDFPEIYKYLKENGVFVEIYTNGYHLNDEILDLFSKYPPYQIEVSIYGISDDVFQKNTGRHLSANVVLENIEKLIERGVKVRSKTPVNKLTVVEFQSIKNWCEQRGIKHYHSTDMTTAYDGMSTADWQAEEALLLEYDAENEIEFRAEYGVPESVGDIKKCFTCSVGSYGLYINSDFQMMPCSAFNNKTSSHNIIDKGIKNSILDMLSHVNSVYHNSISGCVGCSASNYCKMCPAKANEIIDAKGEISGYETYEAHCDQTRDRFGKIELIIENTPSI